MQGKDATQPGEMKVSFCPAPEQGAASGALRPPGTGASHRGNLLQGLL